MIPPGSGTPTCEVVVLLGEPLRDRVSEQEVAGLVRLRLEALARHLGVPADLRVTAHQHAGRTALALTVRGRAIDIERTLDRQVLAALGASAVTDVDGTPSPWATAGELGIDLAEAITQVVEGTVAARPSRLLGPEELRRWAADAGADAGTSGLGVALVSALDLWLSVADRVAVMEALTVTEQAAVGAEIPAQDRAERVVAALRPTTLEIRVEPAYLREITTLDDEEIATLLPLVRQSLHEELGVRLPDFRLVEDDSLPSRSFRFRINDLMTPPVRGFAGDRVLVNGAAAELSSWTPDAEAGPSCVLRGPNAVAPASTASQLEAAGYTTWTPFGHLTLALAETARHHARAFVDRRCVKQELALLEGYWPALVAALRTELSPERLARLLRALAGEGIPIRNLRHYAQTIVDLVDRGELGSDPDVVAAIRRASPGIVTARAARARQTVVAYLLDPELEAAAVAAAQTETLDDDDALRATVVSALDLEFGELPASVALPALIASGAAREPIRRAVEAAWPRLLVLGHDELLPSTNVQPIARVTAG